MKIESLIQKLPYQARSQIMDVYCPDEGKEPNELTLREVIGEVQNVIDRMNMDISENQDVRRAKRTKAACERWMNKYSTTT